MALLVSVPLLFVPTKLWPQTQQAQLNSGQRNHLGNSRQSGTTLPQEYRVGANDVLDINVFEAPELNRSLHVSAGGEISMPLIGSVQAAGLTTQELERALDAKFSEYIKRPQVGVVVTAIHSHPVSVLGAVKDPGTFQLDAPTTLLQILSKAGGLADDAGGEILVMRGGADPAEPNPQEGSSRLFDSASTVAGKTAAPKIQHSESDGAVAKRTLTVNVDHLMESGNPEYNIPIFPGDIITVNHAGIVYVVGGVNRPGGFVMKSNENMTVLKALALAEGLKATSAKSHARIIRMDQETGRRTEIAINLGKMLSGKSADAPLEASDILFVPNSAGKSALLRGTEAAIQTASGVIIWHRYQ